MRCSIQKRRNITMASKKNNEKSLTLAQSVISAMIAALTPLMEFDAGSPQPRLEQGENEDAIAFVMRLTAAVEEHKAANAGKALAFRAAINEALSPCLAMIPSAPTAKATAGNRSTYDAVTKGKVYDLLNQTPRPSANTVAKETGVNVNTVILWRGKWSMRDGLTPLPREQAVGTSALSV